MSLLLLENEDIIWDTEEPKFQSHAAQRTLRGKETASPLNEPVLRGMINEYTKKKLVHEERDNN